MKKNSKSDILQDVLLLYELSLSIGKSLDFYENADAFLRTMMSRKNLEFTSIWVKSLLEDKSDHVRFYSIPQHRPSVNTVRLPTKIKQCLEREDKHPLLLSKDSDALIDKNIGPGTYAYFPLGDFGMLELFSQHSGDKLSAKKLVQLEKVVLKFGNMLQASLLHEKLKKEIKQRTEAEQRVESIARFPEENPSPIIRISVDYRLMYANRSASYLLTVFDLNVGHRIPDVLLNEIIGKSNSLRKEFEMKVGMRYYSFLLVEFRGNDYMNIYGKEITEKKEAEISLRESEMKYRQLVEAANDIIYSIDTLGYVTYANPKAIQTIESSEEAIIGRFFGELVHPSQREEVVGFYYKQLTENIESTYLRFASITDTGAELWLAQTVRAIVEDDKVTGFTAIARDVTENVRAEQQLKRSEEKYRGIIENMNLGLLEVNNNEIINYANASFCKITGYSQQELIGKNASELLLMHHEEKKMMIENHKLCEGGLSNVYEMEIKHRSGKNVHTMVSGAPLYDQHGKVEGSVGIHLDVTDRITSEEALRESENKLRAVIDSSLDAVISIDEIGFIIEWNRRAEEIFGYSREEALGREISETIIPHKYRRRHNLGVQRFLNTGYGPVLHKRLELEALRKDGSSFHIELSIAPIKVKGHYVFSAFVRDITLEKMGKLEMEKALQKEKELNELKSKFVSMTSHEFRTPLTTIQANAELLEFRLENETLIGKDKVDKNLQRINGEIMRLTHLLNDILLLGRVEAGKIPFNLRSTDAVALVEELLSQSFSTQKDHRKVTLTVKGRARELLLDEHIFSHILSNLITNALKYSQDRPAPEVKIDFRLAEVVFSVTDYGIGIPEDDRTRLFDSFFRASNVDNIQGTGLGLSIVKQYTAMHKGQLEVTSKVGIGSTFSVVIPY